MRKNIKHIIIVLLMLIFLSGCSTPSNEISASMEERFKTVVHVTDMNKSLVINIDDDDKIFRLSSDMPILIESKSSHFLFFDLAGENYIKLFMVKDGEWVEVKDGLTRSGSRVLSPAETPLLNLDTTWARPELDNNIFKENKDILIRIVLTGEIMKMDTYSSEWRNHEDEILTGELVAAYTDVYVSP